MNNNSIDKNTVKNIEDIADRFLEQLKPTDNLDARRRLEEYREQRELRRLMNDEFDDIA